MSYLGDFDANAVITTRFTTRAFQTGVPTATANANIQIFKGGANLNVIDGLSLNAGSIAGVNVLTVNTAANQTFYTPGSDFDVIFANGNVSGNSIAGEVCMQFSIRNRVVATVTGNLNGSIIGSMNGSVLGGVVGSVGSVAGNLNGSVLGSMNGNVLGNVNGSVGSVLGAIGGNLNGSVLGSMNGNVLGNVNGSVGSVLGNIGGNVNGNVNGSLLGNMNGNIAGNLAGSVGSVTGSVGSVAGNLNGSVLGSLNGSVGSVLAGVNVNLTVAQFIANGLLDLADSIETGLNVRRAIRYTVAATAGNLIGGNTLLTTISGGGVVTPRITAIVEASGNTRTVTLT